MVTPMNARINKESETDIRNLFLSNIFTIYHPNFINFSIILHTICAKIFVNEITRIIENEHN